MAIEITDALRQDITRLQSQLEHLGLPIRWEEPEKLHLTLNFLGRIDEDLEPDINRVITHVCTKFSQFCLTPTFLETMYKKHEPSFLYLGLSGDLMALNQLQKSLTTSLTRLHIPQPHKFLAHITIGRVKKADPVTTKSTLDQVRDFEIPPLSQFTAKAITLYESLLSDKGSHFRLIRRFHLI